MLYTLMIVGIISRNLQVKIDLNDVSANAHEFGYRRSNRDGKLKSPNAVRNGNSQKDPVKNL